MEKCEHYTAHVKFLNNKKEFHVPLSINDFKQFDGSFEIKIFCEKYLKDKGVKIPKFRDIVIINEWQLEKWIHNYYF